MNNIQDNYFNREKSLPENDVSHQFSFNILLIIFSLFILNQTAGAATIVIDAPKRVSAGNHLAINIGISGLDPADDLGAFSLDLMISADPDVFSLSPTIFGGHLGNPNDSLETFVGVDQPFPDVTKLEIFEVSLLQDLSSQSNDFTLFTTQLLTQPFQQRANKSIFVTANNFVLSDAFGNEIAASNPAATKHIAVVPEPSVLPLIALGFAGIRVIGSKKYI